MKKIHYAYLSVAIIMLIAGITVLCISPSDGDVKIHNAVFDARGYDLNNAGAITLDGEWEFYINRFIQYNNFSEYASEKKFVTVPQAWNVYQIDKEKLPSYGYATYRLHVKTSLPKGTIMGVRIFNIPSAYKFYINDELIGSSGTIAKSKSNEVGCFGPETLMYSIKSSEFDIIIHASNFLVHSPGFRYSIYLGTQKNILEYQDRLIAKELIIVGIGIMVFFFYLAIYLFNNKQKYSLYFALLCLVTVLFADLIEQQFILNELFGCEDLSTMIFLLYSSTIWCIYFLMKYIDELFRTKISKILCRVYLVYSIVSQIVYVIFPPIIYTSFDLATNIIQFLGVFSTLFMVIAGIKKGQKDGWLYIMCVCFISWAFIMDIIDVANANINHSSELYFSAIMIAVLIQMIIQGIRYKKYYDKKIAAELGCLQAQIKPHFLFNTINTIVSISYYNIEEARELLIGFGEYLRKSFDFKGSTQFVSLRDELKLTEAYVNIEKARFEERLEVIYDVPEYLDYEVPILVLQPLVENAIKHGILPNIDGGKVEVKIEIDKKDICFIVQDDGVGISDNVYRNSDKRGIGITNIDNRLKELFGRGLTITGQKGVGTVVSWSVPISKRGGLFDKVSINR